MLDVPALQALLALFVDTRLVLPPPPLCNCASVMYMTLAQPAAAGARLMHLTHVMRAAHDMRQVHNSGVGGPPGTGGENREPRSKTASNSRNPPLNSIKQLIPVQKSSILDR
jgi:hypothetical protein